MAILALTLFVLWLANTSLLEDFYNNEKRQAMIAAFEDINSSEGIDYNSVEFSMSVEKLQFNSNISVFISDSSGNVIISTVPQEGQMFERLLSALFYEEQESGNVLTEGDNYVIIRQEDIRLGEDYLVLCGTLDDGNLIMIRTAVEGIKESTGLANRFLIVVGIIALCFSIVLTIVGTRRITRPIIRLTELSSRMSKLDFSAKYESQRHRNEVDVLGEHMNEMADSLEQSILELKQANHDLQADLALREESQNNQRLFVANVSHELKTPIAVIQGYAEALADGMGADPDSCEYYCGVIIDEAKRMNRMVLSLISLNQLESGASQVVYQHFDIVDMLGGILATMGILFEKSEVSLEFDDTKQRLVYADEFMVEQVLNNYMSNALHYAKGDKRIKIWFTQLDGRLKISVFNTGDPIPEESIDQIWDKFYKVDAARTREYGGTGIGLSIVKAVANSLGQEYGVLNHPDGVEFWFTLEC